MSFLRTNFACLEPHDRQLVRLGMLAERYSPDDPNTCLLQLRQLTELLAQRVAAKWAFTRPARRLSTTFSEGSKTRAERGPR